MLFRMLKKDLSKKRVMNCILTLFILLATLFVASGISNVITVMNGSDYFLDKAGLGDYVVLTMREGGYTALDDFLKDNPNVKGYRLEKVVYSEKSDYRINGEKISLSSTAVLTDISDNGLTYFDKDNQVIETITPGHCYVSGHFLTENNCAVGDTIQYKKGRVELSLLIDGTMKDAVFGSEMMGNVRLLLSHEDMEKVRADEETVRYYGGEMSYIDTDDVKALAASLTDVDNIGFDGARVMIKTTYVMSLILAFIVLILSVVLIVVSFLVLRFAINLSILEDYHEIGVMKAVGIRVAKIRSMYASKYFTLAIVGTLIGGALSFPFGKVLIDSVSKNMVLGNDSDVLAHIIGALLVVLVISAFAWRGTKKVKKMSPVDAIRNGQTGERFRKKKGKRIAKTRGSSEMFLARNDLRSTPKRYLSVILSIAISMMLVLVIVNTSETMLGDRFIDSFAARSDLYIGTLESGLIKDREQMDAYMEELAKKITDAGMPCTISTDIQYVYNTVVDGKAYKLNYQQGINTTAADYKYLDGMIPQNANEVAITDSIHEKTGLSIGDTFTVDFGEQKIECLVTATYQTMNNMGDIIRFHEDAPTDLKHYKAMLAWQVNFTDHPDAKEIDARCERLKELLNTDEVRNAADFCSKTMGVADTMVTVQNLLLIITLIVVLLVIVLMERSFVADEKSQIAILKAVGFRNNIIVRWHVLRFAICAAIAVVAAIALSIPMTYLCITPIFRMMGLKTVDYAINPLKLIIYTGIVFVFTILVAWITAQCVRRVKSSDTANNE